MGRVTQGKKKKNREEEAWFLWLDTTKDGQWSAYNDLIFQAFPLECSPCSLTHTRAHTVKAVKGLTVHLSHCWSKQRSCSGALTRGLLLARCFSSAPSFAPRFQITQIHNNTKEGSVSKPTGLWSATWMLVYSRYLRAAFERVHFPLWLLCSHSLHTFGKRPDSNNNPLLTA